MPYPMTGTAKSGSLKIHLTGVETIQIDHWTRHWNTSLFLHEAAPANLYPPQNRHFSLKIWKTGVISVEENLIFSGQSKWVGLGGLVYIPSFPQLSRKETTWPHAT